MELSKFITIAIVFSVGCWAHAIEFSESGSRAHSNLIKIYKNSDEVLTKFINTHGKDYNIEFTDKIHDADLVYNFVYGGFAGGCDLGACLTQDLMVKAVKNKNTIKAQYSIKTSHIRDLYPGDLGIVQDEGVSERLLQRNELFVEEWISGDPFSKIVICKIYEGFVEVSKKNLIDYCLSFYKQGLLFEFNK